MWPLLPQIDDIFFACRSPCPMIIEKTINLNTVGFYLERIGFSKEELVVFKEQVTNLKFYTDKNQDKYLFDSYWQMFYLPD